jgi:hypothetical protein
VEGREVKDAPRAGLPSPARPPLPPLSIFFFFIYSVFFQFLRRVMLWLFRPVPERLSAYTKNRITAEKYSARNDPTEIVKIRVDGLLRGNIFFYRPVWIPRFGENSFSINSVNRLTNY